MHADRGEVFDLIGSEGFAEASARERDPRIDPQSGDVLAVGTDVREVWDVAHGQVEYGFPRRAANRWLPLIRWQAWARNAEVRKVAP